MAIVILLVATWLNYRRHLRPKVGLNLAMEGWAGEGLAGGGVILEGAASRGRNDAERREAVAGTASAREREKRVEGEKWEESEKRTEGGKWEEEGSGSGRETIYRGILWMKEKYEQYREQADLRYERLKEELGRSERRYHELVAAMQYNRNGMPGTALVERVQAAPPPLTAGEGDLIPEYGEEMTAGEGEILGEIGNGGLLVSEAGGEVLRSELRIERLKVKELERELQTERLKAEELVIKLQDNSQLLMNIYQELDKSLTSARVVQ